MLFVGISFTVELCEAVQVQTIELGNLELFSSLPQSFEVYVSERFVHIIHNYPYLPCMLVISTAVALQPFYCPLSRVIVAVLR